MLSLEQESSAIEALKAARICHGDTTEVEIAVGVMSSPEAKGDAHLAFCSAVVRAGRVLHRGSNLDHQVPISGDIVFHREGRLLRKLQGKTGIVYMRGTVITNGHIEFKIRPSSIRVSEVESEQVYDLRSSSGRRFALKALCQIS